MKSILKNISFAAICRISLLAVLALGAGIFASLVTPAGIAGGVSAFLTALVFAFVWQVSRAGGIVLCLTAMTIFGLFVLGDFAVAPVHPLAMPHAVGYFAGVVWAAVASVMSLVGEFRILSLHRLHKYY